MVNDDGSLSTKVYRKPTHTDQYLSWESNHHLEHKRSVVRTLLRRADKLVSNPSDKQREVEHVKKALMANGYLPWALEVPPKEKQPQNKNNDPPKPKRYPVGLPYVPGLSDKLYRVFKSHDMPAYHKPSNTLRSLLVKPKDVSDKMKQCGLVYRIECSKAKCKAKYIGETGRALEDRWKEHVDPKRPSSACVEHTFATGHRFSTDDLSVVLREGNPIKRKIYEALKIHQQDPSLNKNRGKETIPPILLQLLPRDLPGHVV